MISLNKIFIANDDLIDYEWNKTDKEIKSYFNQMGKISWDLFKEVQQPLWMQMNEKMNGNEDLETFYKKYAISFTLEKGFKVIDAKDNSPAIAFRTLFALTEVAKRMFETQDVRFNNNLLAKKSVHYYCLKPMIKWIRNDAKYQNRLITKVIENYKSWFPHIRDNFIIPASPSISASRSDVLALKQTPLVSLDENPPMPEEHPIDEVEKEKWIALHSCEEQKIAKKFVKNISYISYNKFLQRLHASVESFKREIQHQPYVVVLPEEGKDNSNYWVTSLGVKYLKDHPPVQVLLAEQLPEFLMHNKSLNNLVFFDDASYSGDQMSGYLKKLGSKLEGMDHHIYLIIPFMGYNAERCLEKYWISERQKMFTVYQLFHDDKVKNLILKNAVGGYNDVNPEQLSLTYFAHKVADNWSIHNALIEGTRLGDSSLRASKTHHFVPKFTPPYKHL